MNLNPGSLALQSMPSATVLIQGTRGCSQVPVPGCFVGKAIKAKREFNGWLKATELRGRRPRIWIWCDLARCLRKGTLHSPHLQPPNSDTCPPPPGICQKFTSEGGTGFRLTLGPPSTCSLWKGASQRAWGCPHPQLLGQGGNYLPDGRN